MIQFCNDVKIQPTYNIVPQFQYGWEKMTFAMFLASKGIIPMKRFQHNPCLQNASNYTVAMLLLQNKIIIPKQWCYDPYIGYDKNISLYQYLSKYNVIPPRYLINMATYQENFIIDFKYQRFPIPSENQETNPTIFDKAMLGQIPNINGHKGDEQNEDGWTVAMLLAFNKVNTPIEWQHDPYIKNKYDQTAFNIYVLKQHVPPQWSCKDVKFQNKYGNTQAMILALNNIEIPDYLYHDPNIQNNDGNTVAMILAINNKQIPEKLCHNKFIRNNLQQTVQNLYQKNNQQVPEYWQYSYIDSQQNTKAMIQAEQGNIPGKQHYHDSLQNNKNNDTVAILLSQNGIIPPREWMHDINLKNNKGDTIKSNLQKHQLPIPYHWHDDDMTIFDKAYFKIVPDIQDHQVNEQDEDGWTVAMILIINSIEVPQQWQHDPNIQNKYGQTAFDIYIQRRQQPLEWSYQKADYQDKDGNTQAILLAKNKFKISECLYHDPNIQNNKGQTVAMIQANNGKIPDKQWIHNKYLRCKYKVEYHDNCGYYCCCEQYYTVQNILQYKNIQISDEWKYKPLNNDEDNQAMIDARNGIIPKLDNNDPRYQNKHGDTVAMIVLKKGIIPPKQWMHDINMTNQNGESIKSLLNNMGYIYKNSQIIPNCKIQTLDGTCQICLTEGKQEFIVTRCNHKICLECFEELFRQDSNCQCPVCRQNNWYEKENL